MHDGAEKHKSSDDGLGGHQRYRVGHQDAGREDAIVVRYLFRQWRKFRRLTTCCISPRFPEKASPSPKITLLALAKAAVAFERDLFLKAEKERRN